jgi:hypothetical protein
MPLHQRIYIRVLDCNSSAVNVSVFLGRGAVLMCEWFMVFRDIVVFSTTSTDGGGKIIVLSKPLGTSLTYAALHLRKN